jgi:hypothetical protein
MIRYSMTSPDVDAQIELLKLYPEISDKHYQPALKNVTEALAHEIRPQIPRGTTGRAQATFRSQVRGSGMSIQGEVGWWGKAGGEAWYVRLLEGGAKAHEIPKVSKRSAWKPKVLHFGGVFRRSVRHPGISGRGFMQRAWDRTQELAEREFTKANEAIVNELAVP